MIGFVGLSHLGVVSSVVTAAKGFQVIGFDPDAALCDELNKGRIPFFEPDLAELRAAHSSRIRFTANVDELRQCKVIYFSRDVPTDQDNRSDLTAFRPLLDQVMSHALPGTSLVILSQVPPGFTRSIANTLLHSTPGQALDVYYQVETLIFGRAVERAMRPERFIVGRGNPKNPLPAAYATLLDAFSCPVHCMAYESAELSKIAINMCLVSSVTVANTLAELCEVIGADWADIVPTLKLDKRIGPHAYLSPGLGIAGGNFERDLITIRALAAEHGTDASVVTAWLANSQYRKDWALKILHREVLSKRENPTVAIWGLAYKPDTTSTKNAPALSLIDALGPFSLRTFDPKVSLPAAHVKHVAQASSALDACDGAHALAIMTPWKQFHSVDLSQLQRKMAGQVLVDPYGILDRQRCLELGFRYFRLGTPFHYQERAA